MIFKSDEAPVITLVLLNARVLLLLDWLNDAKNFVLLESDFIPPGCFFHSNTVPLLIKQDTCQTFE